MASTNIELRAPMNRMSASRAKANSPRCRKFSKIEHLRAVRSGRCPACCTTEERPTGPLPQGGESAKTPSITAELPSCFECLEVQKEFSQAAGFAKAWLAGAERGCAGGRPHAAPALSSELSPSWRAGRQSLGKGVVRPMPSGLVASPSWARPFVVAGGATCALKRALVQAGIEAKSARQSPPFW